MIQFVVVDLGENDLLGDPHTIVAPAVEGSIGKPPEIPDPGHRQAQQPVQKFIHAVAAKSHLGPNWVLGPDLEIGNRFLGIGHQRLLARDYRHIIEGALEHVGVLPGVSQTHVDNDFIELRHLPDIVVTQGLHQLRPNLLEVAFLEPGHIVFFCAFGLGFGLRRGLAFSLPCGLPLDSALSLGNAFGLAGSLFLCCSRLIFLGFALSHVAIIR